ncbi:hypothetical protein LIER_41845 [Lithospermum erythrorhizon]|uniref:Uncharacterized protein n=1 Tax=Lithospermum erythrorhizon TaxID=34254 RepID=A0AAV3RJA3_LITER
MLVPTPWLVLRPLLGQTSSHGLLIPFAWLALTVFQVACLAVEVVPNLALFCTMYNVIHKRPLCYFQVASPPYNFLYTKKVDKLEPSSWFELWFLAKGVDLGRMSEPIGPWPTQPSMPTTLPKPKLKWRN